MAKKPSKGKSYSRRMRKKTYELNRTREEYPQEYAGDVRKKRLVHEKREEKVQKRKEGEQNA